MLLDRMVLCAHQVSLRWLRVRREDRPSTMTEKTKSVGETSHIVGFPASELGIVACGEVSPSNPLINRTIFLMTSH